MALKLKLELELELIFFYFDNSYKQDQDYKLCKCKQNAFATAPRGMSSVGLFFFVSYVHVLFPFALPVELEFEVRR